MNPQQPTTSKMSLKVLYTFDNKTMFLSRSSSLYSIKHTTINQNQMQTNIGGIDLRKCLETVINSSPERFSNDCDYAIYSRDPTEPDEPLVGHGLFSKFARRKRGNDFMVSGRVCANLSGLICGNASKETLEVRLVFNSMEKRSSKVTLESTVNAKNPSSDNNNSDTEEFALPPLRRRTQKAAPEKASRSQSLFVKPSKVSEETISIAQSLSENRERLSRGMKCINCRSTTSKSWKFYSKGIFEFGNSGSLCDECNLLYNSSDISALRERGRLAADGLLDSPYHTPAVDDAKKRNSIRKRQKIASSPKQRLIINNQVIETGSSPLENQLKDVFSDFDIFKENPLTDIDPLPQRAAHANTQLIQLEDDDKENAPPFGSPRWFEEAYRTTLQTINEEPKFEPTPKDQGPSPKNQNEKMAAMPSSPVHLDKHTSSPSMINSNKLGEWGGSSPQSEMEKNNILDFAI